MTTGDRLIQVFTDRPPVRMSTVTCPGCGLGLDAICDGWNSIPPVHLLAMSIHRPGQGKRDWRLNGRDLPGRMGVGNSGPDSTFCPVDNDALSDAVAMAQHLAAGGTNTLTPTTNVPWRNAA